MTKKMKIHRSKHWNCNLGQFACCFDWACGKFNVSEVTKKFCYYFKFGIFADLVLIIVSIWWTSLNKSPAGVEVAITIFWSVWKSPSGRHYSNSLPIKINVIPRSTFIFISVRPIPNIRPGLPIDRYGKNGQIIDFWPFFT